MSRPASNPTHPTLFFVAGCQRSGTTLLNMSLEAHQCIDMHDETEHSFHNQGQFTLELNLNAVARELEICTKRSLGFKVPRDSHQIDRIVSCFFPVSRVLWIERDQLQTVASMISLKNEVGSWASRFAPREIGKHIAHFKDKNAASILDSINRISSTRGREVSLASLCWIIKHEQLKFAHSCLGESILAIKYDDLVAAPRDTLGRALEFLELPWSEKVLRHQSILEQGQRAGQALASRSIDIESITKWRRTLSDDDIETIRKTNACWRRSVCQGLS